MSYDGSLKFDTKIDSSGMPNQVSSLGSKLTSLVKGVAMGYTGKTLVQYFIGNNAEMETYLTSFETMLGDAEKAKTLMNNLKSFASVTPFDTANLADATKTLLSFGVGLEDVQDDLKMLGDISQGNNEKLKSLALVFGQIKSAGKLMGQDLLQLINVGFNPLQAMSQQTGKSMSELKEEMSDGAISFDMVKDAMVSATSEGGLFFGSMEKQSKTMSGMISTLKDNLAEFGRDAGEKAFEQTKNSLQGLLDMIDKASKDGTLEVIAEDIGNALNALITTIINVSKFLYEYKNAVLAGTSAMVAFKTAMAGYSIITGVIGAYKTLKTAIDAGTVSQLALNGAMSANPVGLVIAGISALVAVVATLALTTDKGTNSLKNYNSAMENINNEIDSANKSGEGEIEQIKTKANLYEQLRNKVNLTADEKQQLKTVAEDLQKLMPKGIELIDSESGSYLDLSKSIDLVISKKREEMRLKSLEKKAQVAYDNKDEVEATYKKYFNDDGTYKVNPYSEWYNEHYKWNKEANAANKAYTELIGNINSYETAYTEYIGNIQSENQATTQDSNKKISDEQSKAFKEQLDQLERSHTRKEISDAEYYSKKDALLRENNAENLKENDSFYGSKKSFEETSYKNSLSAQEKANKEALSEQKKADNERIAEEKKVTAELEKEQKEQTDNFKSSLKTIYSERKKANDDLISQQESMRNKLSSVTLSSYKTDTDGNKELELEDLSKQLNQLQRYGQLLDVLRSKKGNESLISRIISMDVTSAVDLMEKLNRTGKTDSTAEKLAEIDKTSDDISKANYKDKVNSVQENFIDKIEDAFGQLGEETNQIGQDTADQFIDGLLSRSDEVYSIIENWINSSDNFENLQNAVIANSPSNHLVQTASEGANTVNNITNIELNTTNNSPTALSEREIDNNNKKLAQRLAGMIN